jgi:FkbM family methyltransferase
MKSGHLFFAFVNFFHFLRLSFSQTVRVSKYDMTPPEFCSSYSSFDLVDTVRSPSFKMLVYSADDIVSRIVKETGNYEQTNSHFFLNVLELLQDPVILDFGANLGWFSLLAASKQHSTISIEVMPCNHWALSQSIELNHFQKYITLHQKALSSNSSDTTTICLESAGADHDNRGNGYLENQKSPSSSLASCRPGFTVPVSPLLPLIPQGTNLGFMKADCEGCEPSVLLGSKSLFTSSSAPCAFLIEWSHRFSSRFQGTDAAATMRSVVEMLHDAGYVFLAFARPYGLIEFDFLSRRERVYFTGKQQMEMKAILTTDRCFPRNGDRWKKLFSQV